MSEKKEEKVKHWYDIIEDDIPKKGHNRRCKYCGKELPEPNSWWCNSIHRFWQQICFKRRMK